MITASVFYLVSGILILSALMMVIKRNLFTCALYLASALTMVAAIYLLLGADFLAAVQILLYVGGILVIIAFAVMLSSIQISKTETQKNEQWIPSILVSAGLLWIIFVALKKYAFEVKEPVIQPTTKLLGHLLLRDMALPFELVSLVLLASLIGAIHFSKKEKESGK